MDGSTLVFVEVKARTSKSLGNPEGSVTPRKQLHILNSAQHYLSTLDQPCDEWRVDVVAVTGKPDSSRIDIQVFKNATLFVKPNRLSFSWVRRLPVKQMQPLAIAQRLNGEIISCDSRLFYRGMDIGTAKPSPAQLAAVPHHLIDIADPDEPVSLAVYQEMCIGIIARLHSENKIPVLVGGTGQYLFAITEAWNIPGQEPDIKIRTVLERIAMEQGIDGLFRYLQVLDPQAASTIDRRNIRRVVRALEVIYMTGYKFSGQKSKGTSPYKLIQIGLNWPREELYRRIDLRIDKMFADGLVQEVAGLLQKGYTTKLPGMSAIGYNEVALYLAGNINTD